MRRELEQFFSSDSVGRVITSSLDDLIPSIALDVGFGTGSLLKAVSQRWKNTRLIGVDIDPNLVNAEIDASVKIERLMADGLDHNLPDYISKHYGNVDLVVSNPPYKSIERTSNSDLILSEAGLLDCIGPQTRRYPAELVFLAQNLRILSDNGTLAIVVPSGIVNSEKWNNLRVKLTKICAIEQVIELPDRAFIQTEAKTFVIVLRKGGKTEKVVLSRADQYGEIDQSYSIYTDTEDCRLDWSYFTQFDLQASKTVKTIEDLGGKVFRGKYSMSAARRLNLSQVHTTDLINKEISLDQFDKSENLKHYQARAGDILISRVGSRCIGRFSKVTSGQALVSDCVFVVRFQGGGAEVFWRILNHPENKGMLEIFARGVCAKYLTKTQLLKLPFRI